MFLQLQFLAYTVFVYIVMNHMVTWSACVRNDMTICNLDGVAYPGVWDNRSTINTKTGYDDDDDDVNHCELQVLF